MYCIIVAIPEAVTVDDGAIANYEALRLRLSCTYVCLCLDTDRRILNAEPLRLSPLGLFPSFLPRLCRLPQPSLLLSVTAFTDVTLARSGGPALPPLWSWSVWPLNECSSRRPLRMRRVALTSCCDPPTNSFIQVSVRILNLFLHCPFLEHYHIPNLRNSWSRGMSTPRSAACGRIEILGEIRNF